jgi:hypothetical protein
MLDEYKRLEEERLAADNERKEAVSEKEHTEEVMQTTIRASWKQGSDANGKN